jgi:hypothetical protein
VEDELRHATMILIFFVGTCFGQTTSATSSAATISGHVVSSDGTPLSAILTVNSTTSASAPNLTTTSASDGSFQLSNVPAGSYQICVTVQSGNFVDPCLWSSSMTAFPLAAAQSAANQVIQVQKAAVVHVRINDPQHLCNTATSGGTPRGVVMGVLAPGSHFYSLLPTSTNSTGFDQQIPIPGGTSVPFKIVPMGLTITDSSGNAVAATGATVNISVSQANLSTPMVLTYNVTGTQ